MVQWARNGSPDTPFGSTRLPLARRSLPYPLSSSLPLSSSSRPDMRMVFKDAIRLQRQRGHNEGRSGFLIRVLAVAASCHLSLCTVTFCSAGVRIHDVRVVRCPIVLMQMGRSHLWSGPVKQASSCDHWPRPQGHKICRAQRPK